MTLLPILPRPDESAVHNRFPFQGTYISHSTFRIAIYQLSYAPPNPPGLTVVLLEIIREAKGSAAAGAAAAGATKSQSSGEPDPEEIVDEFDQMDAEEREEVFSGTSHTVSWRKARAYLCAVLTARWCTVESINIRVFSFTPYRFLVGGFEETGYVSMALHRQASKGAGAID